MFSANSSQVSNDKLFVEDVFSTYLYAGNGSSHNTTNTIINGIDLAGKGGLVWIKSRTDTAFNNLFDTNRGVSSQERISSNSDGAAEDNNVFDAFNSNGFTANFSAFAPNSWDTNRSGQNYASWTFREAPKFFDVVTYTGNDTSRSIAHNLGSVPGMIIIKNVSQGGFNWVVYHRSLGATQWLKLNLTDAVATNASYFPTDPTSTTFAIGNGGLVNNSGGTYVAYLYAHDAASDGIIQCGSYTAGGSPVVTLGWEPQWLMIKNVTTGDVYQDWYMFDNMRKLDVSNSGNAPLRANTSGVEGGTYATSGYNLVQPTATGFIVDPSAQGASGVNNGSDTYIYMAIRRGPMRTPTLGTSVFTPVAISGDNTNSRVITTTIRPDTIFYGYRNNSGRFVFDRLRGSTVLNFSNTNAEFTSTNLGYTTLGNESYTQSSTGGSSMNVSGWTYINWAMTRAPGFMDEVCYTGTGSARTVAHNLGVTPELMIVKTRSDAGWDWYVYASSLGGTKDLRLNTEYDANTVSSTWNNTNPSATTFTVGSSGGVNGSGQTFVAYLFASCPGVSKVGSYTGNGSSQTINCGFAAGARFVMIKRTDGLGNWFVWDSARGIVAGNDPRLSLNNTDVEVTTDDSVDTDSSGFVVNQVSATNVNVNAATYIYLAIA